MEDENEVEEVEELEFTELWDEIADATFRNKIEKMVRARVDKERKKKIRRKCEHCDNIARPRFLIGSNVCDHCFTTGAGCGGFDY
jgi:ribosomal protein L37AE/L43A